eukprot:13137141-Alexandrium_andersonii.AAC.1
MSRPTCCTPTQRGCGMMPPGRGWDAALTRGEYAPSWCMLPRWRGVPTTRTTRRRDGCRAHRKGPARTRGRFAPGWSRPSGR